MESASLHSAAMWGGLQGADTALAGERIAQHMQRKSRALTAPAMKALAEEDEEGEEDRASNRILAVVLSLLGGQCLRP